MPCLWHSVSGGAGDLGFASQANRMSCLRHSDLFQIAFWLARTCDKYRAVALLAVLATCSGDPSARI
jgi:hypothetical protein